MGNLMAVDFYKIFRTKSFYVIGAILLAITVLNSAVICSGYIWAYEEQLSNMANTASSFGSSFGNAWSIIFSSFSNISSLVAMMSILFMCSEFSFGTMKNIASKGYSRMGIYLSKFLISALCLCIYFILTFITSFVTCVVVVGNRVPNFFKLPTHMFLPLFFIFLFLLVDISFALMISSLVKKSGQAIATYIVPTLIANILLSILDINLFKNILKTDFRLSDYVYTSCLSEVLRSNLITQMYYNDIVRYFLVAVVFLLVTMLVGIYFFRKRDI